MKYFIPLLLPLTLLAGCASPESRLRSGLYSAGLSHNTSTCMAQKMVDRLSLVQLRRLSSLGSLRDTRIADLSVAQFLHKIRALNDTGILDITTRAGLSCAIMG
jgi:hypothetical protein